MKALLRNSLVCLLSSGMLMAQSTDAAQSSATSKPRTSRTTARRRAAAAPAGPSTADQLKELHDMLVTQQQQIRQLQNQLAARGQQVQQAQQAASDANAKASDAAAKATAAQSANSDANTQVASLKETVSAVKANDQNLAETIQSEQKRVNEATESPAAIRFKGITISPTGSFIAAETIWRQRGLASDVNTPFSSIPFNGAQNGNLSEFNASGRQSRLALLAEGKAGSLTLRGYYEADWLSAGTTSNSNESNSYTNRQRQIFAQVQSAGGWIFTGGQMWSLSTETKSLLDNRSENLPMTIDSQYNAGFTWERQYGARVVKDFGKKAALGFSIEEPQMLNVGGGGLSGTTGPGAVFQLTGTLGGLLNNQANYSFNVTPDFIAKAAFEPGWGHYEVFGIARLFRDRVYPNAGTKSAAAAFNSTASGGGIGGNLRVPTFHKKVDVGLHLLAGAGVGRYGSSTLADVTFKPDGSFEPLRGGSALGSIEIHATPKLDVYTYYGGDYAERALYGTGATQLGYGRTTLASTGCSTEVAPAAGGASLAIGPANCSPDTRAVQEFTLGYWYDFYKGTKGRIRQGLQYSYFTKNTWRGTGGAPSAVDNMVWTSFRYYLP
jgi:hypothetical protein